MSSERRPILASFTIVFSVLSIEAGAFDSEGPAKPNDNVMTAEHARKIIALIFISIIISI